MRYTLNAIGLGDHSKALTTLAFVHTMKAGSSPSSLSRSPSLPR